MTTNTEDITMATARRSAFWTHYDRVLSQAGIGTDERETILFAEARDRVRAYRARLANELAALSDAQIAEALASSVERMPMADEPCPPTLRDGSAAHSAETVRP
jgi:hypothetical protein